MNSIKNKNKKTLKNQIMNLGQGKVFNHNQMSSRRYFSITSQLLRKMKKLKKKKLIQQPYWSNIRDNISRSCNKTNLKCLNFLKISIKLLRVNLISNNKVILSQILLIQPLTQAIQTLDFQFTLRVIAMIKVLLMKTKKHYKII